MSASFVHGVFHARAPGAGKQALALGSVRRPGCRPHSNRKLCFPRCYWGFHGHFSREAEHLYHTLESSYQKALQSHLKNSDSVVSLPQSDRSSSSSQESLK